MSEGQVVHRSFDCQFQADATSVGNGNTMNVGGLSDVGVQVSGVIDAVIVFEAKIAGNTWYSIRAEDMDNGAIVNRTNADGLFVINVKGLDMLRCRISSWREGGINIHGKGVM